MDGLMKKIQTVTMGKKPDLVTHNATMKKTTMQMDTLMQKIPIVTVPWMIANRLPEATAPMVMTMIPTDGQMEMIPTVSIIGLKMMFQVEEPATTFLIMMVMDL